MGRNKFKNQVGRNEIKRDKKNNSGRSRRLASELDRAVRGLERGDADRAEDCFEQHVLGRTNPLDGVMIGMFYTYM